MQTLLGAGRTGLAGSGVPGLYTGLYAYYKFNDSVFPGLDYSANGRDSDPSGGAGDQYTASGFLGGGYEVVGGSAATQGFRLFSGTATSYAMASTAASCAAWIRRTNALGVTGSTNLSGCVGFTASMSFARVFAAGWVRTAAAAWKAAIALPTTGSRTVVVDTATDIAQDTWYHFAATWNPGTTTYTLYVNGSQTLQATYATSLGSFDLGAKLAVFRDQGTTTVPGSYFDEAAFWVGRELSATDVASLYNAGSGLELTVPELLAGEAGGGAYGLGNEAGQGILVGNN